MRIRSTDAMDPAIAPSDDAAVLALRSVLRFPEPLETEYRRDYAERWLATNRTAWVLGLVILAGFGVVDPLAAPTSWGSIAFLLYGVGCVAVLALLVLSTRRSYL